jgi:hypothetical protein
MRSQRAHGSVSCTSWLLEVLASKAIPEAAYGLPVPVGVTPVREGLVAVRHELAETANKVLP